MKQTFLRITTTIKKTLTFKICVVFLSTILVCLTFLLPLFYSDSRIENTADYIAEKTKNDTWNKQYSWLSVSLKDDTDKKSTKLREAYDEYFYWKYIFRHSDYGYSKVVNPNKDDFIGFSEYDLRNDYSLICANRNHNYKITNEEKGTIRYFHEFYDLEFMFGGTRKIKTGDSNFFAISKTDASAILEHNGAVKTGDDFSPEQYESLLDNSFKLVLNGRNVSWTLDNIYLENTNYFNNVSNTLGHFFLTYILVPETVKMTDVYFFNTYTFQNMHKLKAISSYYDKDLVNYKMCSFAFKEENAFDEAILFDGLFPQKTQVFYYILIAIIVTLALMIFYLVISYCPKDNSIKDVLIYLLPCLAPVLFFKILSSILKKSFLFSSVSLSVVSVFYIIYFCVFFFVLLKKGVCRKWKK